MRGIRILGISGICELGITVAMDIRGMRLNAALPQCEGRDVDIGLINDDFCDCGTDEPGTSACSGMDNAPKFYCRNEGAKAISIFSSLVNDGICDCCDGSDENANVCISTCEEEGRLWRQEREEKLRMWQQAQDKKLELENAHKTAELQRHEDLASHRAELEQAKKEHEEHETRVQDLEEMIKNASQSAAPGGAAAASAQAAGGSDDKTTRSHSDSDANRRQETGEKVVETGDSSSAGEGGAKEASSEAPHEPAQKVSEYAKWMDKNADVGDEPKKDQDEEKNAEVIDDKHSPEVSSEAGDDAEDEDDEDDDEDDDGGGAQEKKTEGTESSEQDAELKGLREISNAAKSKVKTLESKISKIQESLALSKKVGKFAPLIDLCMEKTIEGYHYRICFFKDAQQDGTSIGRFVNFHHKIPRRALFKNGRSCPSGKARELVVDFICASEPGIHSVSEPSVCEYHAKMNHPLACPDKKEDLFEHEEL